MKNLNPALLFGILICLFMLFLVVFPDAVSGQGPYVTQSLRSWIEDGSLNFELAPFHPSSINPLGTDDLGRDIWSRIAHGSRLTLTLGILIVFGRFLIALPVALSAGFGNPVAKLGLRLGGIVFSAIPALLFGIIILQQEFFASLSKEASIAAFVIVLSGVGWPKLGLLLSEKTEEILRQPFILSEQAIGKGRLRITLDNVLPHLAPEATVLFFMEMARALSMVMQLGIFNIFVGNIRMVSSTDGGVLRFFSFSFEPEWAGMLGTARSRLSTAPWMVVWPTLIFFLCVFGFNLLGEGIRRNLQESKKTISTPTGLQRLGYFRFAVLSLVIFLAGAMVLPGLINSRHRVELMPDIGILQEDVIVMGTDEAERAAGNIAGEMENLGMNSVEKFGYIVDYETSDAIYLNSSRVSVENSGNRYFGVEGIDYRLLEYSGTAIEGRIINSTQVDIFSPEESGLEDHQFSLIDRSLYSEEAIDWFFDSLAEQGHQAGGVLIDDSLNPDSVYLLDGESERTLISAHPDFAEKMTLPGDTRLSVSAAVDNLGNVGRNILGIVPGNDPGLRSDFVIICLGYNSRSKEEQSITECGLALMKRIASEKSNRRSYLFMYLDGTSSDNFHGVRAFTDSLPVNPADVSLCLDLTGIYTESFDTLIMNTEQAPITRYFAWSIGHMLNESSERAGYSIEALPMINRNGSFKYEHPDSANIMFWKHGVPFIRIATRGVDDGQHQVSDLMSLLAGILERNDY